MLLTRVAFFVEGRIVKLTELLLHPLFDAALGSALLEQLPETHEVTHIVGSVFELACAEGAQEPVRSRLRLVELDHHELLQQPFY